MYNYKKIYLGCLLLTSFLVIGSITVSAQDKKSKKVVIQATAMGTSYQLGRVVSVDLRINDYSTAEDKAVLMQVFAEKGSEGLANALDKMKAKGRIAITGTLGYDVNFIRSFPMPDGSTKYRFVTDRQIQFGEVWGSTRSLDYNLAMGEIVISKDKKSSTGVVYPAARFKLDKDGELTVELLNNPWKLVNVMQR